MGVKSIRYVPVKCDTPEGGVLSGTAVKVLGLIKDTPVDTRTLWKRSKLGRTALSAALNELWEKGKIIIMKPAPTFTGRPKNHSYMYTRLED